MSTTRPPSVDRLARALDTDAPHNVRVAVARAAIAEWRDDATVDVTERASTMMVELLRTRPSRVVNATGVLLHTNLGRAPLHVEAAAAAQDVSLGYGNVELDLATGKRGSRHAYLAHLISSATGSEAATVVNNNAGALLLALAALAAPGRVAVSRGELIEIGGSFRLPELMAASGAQLVEVGTTNRTRLGDYASADDVAAMLKVHPSNYRVEGFAEEASYTELAEQSDARAIPFIADLGSGLLDERTPWLAGAPPVWLRTEPGVRQTLEAGAHVVLFSGDKLLGGPQSGILAGRKDLIERISKHPMMRALRLDGPTLAALTVTLELYAAGRGSEIPFWRMAAVTRGELETRLGELAGISSAAGGRIVDDASLPGAGSVPGERIPTPVLEIKTDVDTIWSGLLGAHPPVLARRHAGALVIDLRTVTPDDDQNVRSALETALAAV